MLKPHSDLSDPEIVKYLAAAFEAERKAGREERSEKWHKAGFQDGLEEAAKIVEREGFNEEPELMRETLADRIRRLGEKR